MSRLLLVDMANVVGSRPDGWWRDRAGAASRLLARLALLPESEVVAVLEGKARSATVPDGLEVLLAPADGDSAIVERARELVAAGRRPLVVTADRGLRDRLPAEATVAGPGWLLEQLDAVQPD